MTTITPYLDPYLVKGTIEEQILKCAGYDDIAPIAVYLHADLAYDKEAKDALKTLKEHCSHLDDIKKLTFTDIEESGIDFGHIYNILFEMIAENYGDVAVDKYGSWGIVRSGTREELFFGDDSGFFPWYLDEETLKKRLKELEEE